MATTAVPSPALVGRRILSEVEETSLEGVLQRIRAETAARAQHNRASAGAATDTGPTTQHGTTYPGRPATSGTATAGSPVKNSAAAPLRLPSFPIPALQQLVARHFRSSRAPELVVGGHRPLALVYLIVATLVAAPCRQTVVVVDAEARFDVRQLLGVQPTASAIDGSSGEVDEVEALASPVTEDDLQHVHVFRVDPRWRVPLAELVAATEQRVLYGAQRRRDRPWWGTIVVGGAGGGGTTGNTSTSSADNSTNSNNTHRHGVGAALVTGSYGWLRVGPQKQYSLEAHKERQERLQALFEDVDLNRSDHDEEMAGAARDNTEGKAEFEPVTWVASSPWGSFAFRLPRPVPVQS